MGKPTGFMEIARQERRSGLVSDRLQNFQEFVIPLTDDEVSKQGARCMDCGIPYCHQGCPVNNIIPDWNDLVYKNRWREAIEVLHSTNNFPEFTGRICPAPCEAACTLNLENVPVTIKTIECAIIDKAWELGWVKPQVASHRSGKKVAVVGSGPAGMACAQQLARVGHEVVVFEKQDRIGGLLRYGIPDFKMSKHLIDRRIAQMQAEGVVFRPNCHIGKDIAVTDLRTQFDAIVLAGGAEQPRDLPIPGRELQGVHFAMEFLVQQNRRATDDQPPEETSILADGKHVIVLGGGDTGSDCVGTSARQGAISITQLEILPQPPAQENKLLTWPNWPLKLRTTSSHEEGCARQWSVSTKSFSGAQGKVKEIQLVRVEWVSDQGRFTMKEIPGSEFSLPADLILLALGFVHPIHQGMVAQLDVDKDPRGNVKANTNDYQTSVNGVFAAGDMRRGQSLVVWAIREGRQCARAVDEYLTGDSELPR